MLVLLVSNAYLEVQNVTFVENYDKVLSVLKANLNNLKLVNNYKILEFDINQNIKLKKIDEKFDIIFRPAI